MVLWRGARAGAGLPMGLVTPWGISARAVHEEQKPMKISHIEEVNGAMSPMGGTPILEQGRSEEEGEAE